MAKGPKEHRVIRGVGLALVLALQVLSCNKVERLDVDAYIQQQDWLEDGDLKSPEIYYIFANDYSQMMDCVEKMTCDKEEGDRRLFSLGMDSYNAFARIAGSQFNMEMTSDSVHRFEAGATYSLFKGKGILTVRYLGATMNYQPEERTYFCAQKDKEGKPSSYIYVHKKNLVELGFEIDESSGFLKLGQEKVVSGRFNTHGLVLPDVYSLQLVKRQYQGPVEHHYYFSYEVNGSVRNEMIYNRAVLMTFESHSDENALDGAS